MKRLWLIIITMYLFSIYSNGQNKNDISTEISLDYGFGKHFNNRATTISTRYNLFEIFRIAPEFSYFITKEKMKMKAITLNFHYIFSDKNSNRFPYLKNQGIYYYPIFGFNVINFTRSTQITNKSNYSYSFGFNVGVGVEYEIPTLQNVFRDMSVNFEIQYIAADKIYRPLLHFGLIYYFKIT